MLADPAEHGVIVCGVTSVAELRLYLDPGEIATDGYPNAWHGYTMVGAGDVWTKVTITPSIKDIVRAQAGHRCVRCGHPYKSGEHGNGEWSPCDVYCTHGEPTRTHTEDKDFDGGGHATYVWKEAQWRVLTVHHLNGIKHDCRWWNLAALCQRCHLSVQTRVVMDRPWVREHSEWFKPYAAGFYASLLGEELTREQTMARLDELLEAHQLQHPLEGL